MTERQTQGKWFWVQSNRGFKIFKNSNVIEEM